MDDELDELDARDQLPANAEIVKSEHNIYSPATKPASPHFCDVCSDLSSLSSSAWASTTPPWAYVHELV